MPRKLLASQLAEARAMLAEGHSLTACGKRIGVDRGTIKYWLNDEYRAAQCRKQKRHDEARKARAKAARRAINSIGSTVLRSSVSEDAERLRKLIPRDTRCLTGRLMNDPLPGRSALDKRMLGVA